MSASTPESPPDRASSPPATARDPSGTPAESATESDAIVGPPVFSRGPRAYFSPPGGTIEIQAPPAMSDAPSFSWATLLLPVAVIVGIVIVSIRSGEPIESIGLLEYMGGLISASLPFIHHRQARLRHQLRAAQEDLAYQAHLEERRRTIATLDLRQRLASVLPNPPLPECLARAEQRDSSLWERSPHDPDFLDLRLGVGRAPSLFAVRVPPPPAGMLPSASRYADAQRLVDASAEVDGVAVPLPLTRVGVAAIVGEAMVRRGAASALLVQMATHHAPDEVKLVVIADETEADAWTWVRWLPHVWSDDRARRFVADDAGKADGLLDWLGEEIERRQRQPGGGSDRRERRDPVFVVVVAASHGASGAGAGRRGPVWRHLLSEGPRHGVFVVCLVHRGESVPQQCRAIVTVAIENGRPCGLLRLVGPPPSETDFVADTIAAGRAEHFARVLAPVRLQEDGETGARRSPISEIGLDGKRVRVRRPRRPAASDDAGTHGDGGAQVGR